MSLFTGTVLVEDPEYSAHADISFSSLALQPLISEDDLISYLTSHYPIHVQKSMIGCNLKNTQDVLNYLSKMEA
jgi:hypothetical protein